MPWRASVLATVVAALAGVALLAAMAAWQTGGLDGETVFFMLVIAFPTAIVLAAPVAFVVMPLARWALDKAARPGALALISVGAVAGFLLPLAVAIYFRSRFVTESWAIAILSTFASTVAGAIGAFVFHVATRPRAP